MYRTKSYVKMYTIDLIDPVCYLNDLNSYGSDRMAYFLRNSLMSYIFAPQLKHLGSKGYLAKSSLYTIYTLLKIIKDKNFIEMICIILLGKNLPKSLLSRLYLYEV